MGMSKDEAARRLREDLGKARDVSQNRTMVDAVSRAVLRNPNPESMAVMRDLKDAIKLFVQKNNDDALLQTLINTANEGGGVMTPAALRQWCDMPNNDPSRDIAVASSLLSAFAYTNLRGNPSQDTPTTAAVRQIMAEAPPYIGTAFGTRGGDLSGGRVERGEMALTEEALARHDQGVHYAPNRTPSLSSGLEGREGFTSTPPQMPKRQTFTPNSEFALACEAAGVPVVGHVSGTTPSNLAAANGLIRDLQISRGQPGKGLDDTAAERLSGLTAARFHRDAFHSAPEVLVGMKHWEAHKHKDANGAFDPNYPEQSIALYRDEKNVRELFVDSVKLMAAASTPIVQECVSVLEDDLRERPTLPETSVLPQVEEALAHDVPLDEPNEEELARLYEEVDQLELDRERSIQATRLAREALESNKAQAEEDNEENEDNLDASSTRNY
jgi:hypothetical protein